MQRSTNNEWGSVGDERSKFTEKAFREVMAKWELAIPEPILLNVFLDIKELLEEEKPRENTRKFIAAYCEAFKRAHGFVPKITGPASSHAKSIVKTCGLDDAIKLVDAYFEMPDTFFIARCHDLTTFYLNITKIQVYANTGKSITNGELRNLDRKMTTVNAFASLLKGREK